MPRTWNRRRLLAAFLAAPAVLSAGNKRRRKKKDKRRGGSAGPAGVLGGTVFTSGGRSLPGATVRVTDPSNPKGKWEMVTDARGEFAFRLPAEEDPVYHVTASAPGFRSVEREAAVYEAQKTNINLLLDPE